MNLFQLGNFILHSGKQSRWKIDCDAFTDEDYETLAWIVAKEWKWEFKAVVPIPTGGNRFAEKLDKYTVKHWRYLPILIVDDVLTTGVSFLKMRDTIVKGEIFGVVIFAREKCPDWIKPIFQLQEK